jgi:predicted RNA-binding protein with PUA-like domain
MLEKDIENLIALHPEDFFPSSGFKLIGQQIRLGSCFADVVFEDKYDRLIIVEIKRGILSRDASGQIIEYYGLLKQQNPDKVIELILCANIIPAERKVFLENVGIECKELGLILISNIAKRYNYKFLDETEQKIKIEGKTISWRSTIKGDNEVWIFQANPARYDILNALLDPTLNEQGWMVNQHRDAIKQGNIALIWMSGREAGIYAVTEVISDPSFMVDPPEEEKYWTNEKDKGQSRLRVKIKIVRKLVNSPILREELKNIKELDKLSILRFSQGTNFPVTRDEWGIIKQKIDFR